MAFTAHATDRPLPIEHVLEFLHCRTPDAWLDAACADIPTLLLDHASLELRAAEQAQTLIRRYGALKTRAGRIATVDRLTLVRKMSRLAREELRHFEQVLELLAARGIDYAPVSASRYARALHARIRLGEPERCIDTLIVGAIIEARSCERFYGLLAVLTSTEPALSQFYASLLRAEARHFEDYLALARRVSGRGLPDRLERFLELEARLTMEPDVELRFHSGPPA